MALAPSLSDVAANAGVTAVIALANSGHLRIYSGTKPTNANTALSGNTLLADLVLGATAFGAPAAGVSTANTIASVTAAATGTASFFRVLKSDGTTVLFDGTVGTSGCDLNINSVSIVSGSNVSITSFTFTQPE